MRWTVSEQGLMWTGCRGWGGRSLESSSLLGLSGVWSSGAGLSFGISEFGMFGKGEKT